MRHYPFTVAVGTTSPLEVQGDFIYYLSASAGALNPTIAVKTDRGEEMLLQPGQGQHLRKGAATRWLLSNYEGVASVTGLLLIGTGDFRSNRVAGEVSVIDGEKSRVLAGQAFSLQVFCAGVAAKYSNCQLLNPVGSGKRIVVEAWNRSAEQAGGVSLYRYDTALATLFATAVNKLIGGSALTGQGRTEATDIVAGTGASLAGGYVGALVSNTPHDLKKPLILTAGKGIVCPHTTVDTDLSLIFEGYEETDQ